MTHEESVALHERALAGSRIVSAVLFEQVYPALLPDLCRRYLALHDHEVSDYLMEVIFSYEAHPQQYNPDKLMLDRYIAMAVRGDIKNALHARQKQPLPVSFDPVVHERDFRNSRRATDTTEESDAAHELSEEFMQKLRELFPDERDRKVIELILDGVRETERFSEVLGIDTLDIETQRRRVKQVKDRIRIRMRRLGIRTHV